MQLYICVTNSETVNHPAFEDNLLQAFGEIPAHWEAFVRVDKPLLAPYQKCDQAPTYERVEGTWTDSWFLRDMTAEEKADKQTLVKSEWVAQAQYANYTTWTFNEETCSFIPPVPRPDTGDYNWSGADNNWVLV